ncbi:keratin-associated protein 16-1-like isoform X2 [Venturia canescens]|uniref:keratin-associated protein 16-1-like isoform X2 n=1 Tax=Venturia canescens TaxID=32260 RepID=UPI001C9C7556|nr:keratin-associated protein 16-1-like isoform X2 [Venturia canescens]
MSCSAPGSVNTKRHLGTGCCGSNCTSETTGCLASEPRIRTCLCQENTGCIERGDCGGFHPRGTAVTGACPGPCQCAEEEAWNRNAPPKPNCEWYSNFSELRRQWSDHARMPKCKCCNCTPCKKAPPCKPCLPPPEKSFDIQSCCNDRLSGGANGKSACHSSSYEDDDEESESACKPCSPSPRPILKPRSCCQCIPGYCMCQPMPRTCNCPPPVQVDARAARDCDCECPSSPECACPPSERRFPRTKVKCPNARMCCSTPRPHPGPKCNCTKCQPCLPSPCDPCTSSKCRTLKLNFKSCDGGSPCDDSAPCRPETPKLPPCKPTPPCSECRKMAPSCRPPLQVEHFQDTMRQFNALNRSRTPADFKYSENSASFRAGL